jgi:hypothetical protein
MLVNLTPHPIKIYAADTPDRIDVADHSPLWVLPVADQPPARIGEIPLGTNLFIGFDRIPVEYVEYTSHGGLVHPLPEPDPEVWFVVSLVVAMQQTYVYNRPDLLVPYREVRNLDGTVVGCRQLARPV